MKKSRTGLLLAERACNICLSIALFSLSKCKISCSSLGHIGLFAFLNQPPDGFHDWLGSKDEDDDEENGCEPEFVLAETDFGDDDSRDNEQRKDDCCDKGSDFLEFVHCMKYLS